MRVRQHLRLEQLERRVGASTTAARDCLRAHIVLLRSEGVGQQEVASWLSVSAPSVSKWSQRFDREGLDGLKDKPGRGAKPSIPLATVRRVVEEAGKAPPGRQRWSTRSLAREVGISSHSVARIWQRQGLKPHRLHTFKVSRDKKFEEKFGVGPIPRTGQRLSGSGVAAKLFIGEAACVMSLDPVSAL